ncbi:MAG: YkgJ family cysteine cluster protein [Polyangiaceae bacterium]|nr:YkgJ family cysteine cluster protein [Polyangiaceae bacterium]
MSAYVIERPVWRRFRPQFLARAAAHVRRGGHAALLHPSGRVDMLLTVGENGKITELGLWSLLAIEQRRYRRVKVGAAKELATARVAPKFTGSVIDWCDRDSIHEGAVRRMNLDCLDCGACCHDANVVIDEADFERFREGGRGDLVHKDYIKRHRDGRITLRFAENGKCQHLQRDNKCRIYPLRPDNCRVFVVGSEACLAAREDTLKLRDGITDEELFGAAVE